MYLPGKILLTRESFLSYKVNFKIKVFSNTAGLVHKSFREDLKPSREGFPPYKHPLNIICFKTRFLIELSTIVNTIIINVNKRQPITKQTTDAASWHILVHDAILSNLNLFLMHELASNWSRHIKHTSVIFMRE